MLEKGSQVLYVEFEQGERTKRFVVPESDNIKLKIEQFVKETPGLELVRYGNATVTSVLDDDAHGIGLKDIPSTVIAIYNLDLADHPVLVQGQGRFSKELTDRIEMTELFTAPVASPEAEKPKASVSLTDQLKNQMAAKAIAKASADKAEKEFVKVSAPSTPVVQKVEKKEETKEPVQTTMDFKDFIEKNKKQKEPKALFDRTPRSQPVSKIDKILEKIERIEISLGLQEELEMAEDSVRAEQLRDWFENHIESVGWERTFEILAGKIKI